MREKGAEPASAGGCRAAIMLPMEGGGEVGWGGGRGRAWWGDLGWVLGGGSMEEK